MLAKRRLFTKNSLLVVCALLAACLSAAAVPSAFALQAGTEAQPAADIQEVRTLIEGLPSVMAVTEDDADQIQETRAAFDSLSPEDQRVLDTETNRVALGTTQSYGRVLELAEAGLAVLHPVDDATQLPDGLYTTSASCSWDRGKSASKQDRDWTVARVRVEDGHASVVLRINSSTYAYVRASGIVADRLGSSASDESLFVFPVSLGNRMVFTGYSETMATEIAYNLTVTVADGAQPDASLDDETDEPGGGESGGSGTYDQVNVTVDEATGAVIAEPGTFHHPEITDYMFRIVDPAIVVSDGRSMTVVAQMPSTSYTHFFVGTAEEAELKTLDEGVADGSFIPAELVPNDSGEIVSSFTFPLESLDRDIAVCLYSAKNMYWVNHTIRFDSSQLSWPQADDEAFALAIDLLEGLPARNTIVPDNAEQEAQVRAAREAYDALSSDWKERVPARLVLLLEWDESMFDLGFNTEFLPMGMVGSPYDGALYVSGKNGELGKSIQVASGSLPEGFGVQMDEAGLWARLEGTPQTTGSWAFTVELSNGIDEPVSREFTLHVGYTPVILTESLANAQVAKAYDQVLEVDAYPDATWSLLSGALPDGLSLVDDGAGANTAHISGRPTRAGAFTFTLACDNFANGIETATYTIEVEELDVSGLVDELAETQDELAATQDELAKTQEGLASALVRIDALEALVKKLQAQLPQKVVINAKTVTAKKVKSALKKAHNEHATTITLGSKVKTIKAGAFKGTDVKKLVVKSTKLTKKSVKGSLKGSKVKVVQVKVAKAKQSKVEKKSRKCFTKKNAARKATVK